jgi:predicted dehydrogenase
MASIICWRTGISRQLWSLRFLDDAFLVTAYVEYHPIYHPFNWRGWVDWGNGPLSDMGAHLIDVAMWGLDFGVVNVPAANEYLQRQPRPGWTQ